MSFFDLTPNSAADPSSLEDATYDHGPTPPDDESFLAPDEPAELFGDDPFDGAPAAETVTEEAIEDIPVFAEAALDEEALPESVAPLGGYLPAIIVSALLHVWLVVVLSGITGMLPRPVTVPPIDVRIVEEIPPSEKPDEILDYELANPDDRARDQVTAVNAKSVGQSQSDEEHLEAAVDPFTDQVVSDPIGRVYDIAEGREVDERLVVRGTTGEGLVQIDAALDQVTWEIANNLKERKVFVLWLLDASASMKEQRNVVAGRFRRIYKELDALEVAGQIPNRDQPLLSAVASFGQGLDFRTEATADVDELVTAVETVPDDESGVENVFAAVHQSLKKWQTMRTQNGRRMMVVIVTDEAGDDYSTYLEPSISISKRYGARTYVVGPPAAFGKRQGFVPYLAPEDGRTYQLPVDIGPETAVAENVQMPFWFSGPQYEQVSAGLGPYALSRLVAETGGMYFLTTMVTSSGLAPTGTYATSDLQPFQPDYRFGSLEQFLKDASKHPLRMSIIRAAEASTQYKALGTPQLELRVTPQNYLQTLNGAQQQVAISTAMIDNILAAYGQNPEKDLARESSPRWRMAFCLNYGRLLAQKVRNYEYNSACAQLKLLGTQDIDKKTNHWYFQPDDELNYAVSLKKQAQLADSLLRRVVQESPGSPWAVLAARELKDPFGLTVVQKFDPPVQVVAMPEGPPSRNKTVRLADDRKTPRTTPPPPPPKPRLPKL